MEDEQLEQALNGAGTDQPNGEIWRNRRPSEVHGETVRLFYEAISVLELKVSAQREIIAAYRDALECFQNEKRLASSLHLADIAAITKPKTT